MIKSELHPRNLHREGYDFEVLTTKCPELAQYVAPNKYGTLSINFFNPAAVRALNGALLSTYYGIDFWELPEQALIAPIPGRADYIHYVADLLGSSSQVRVLDIGVGANLIFPIIGRSQYGWNFVGSDISTLSLECAQQIVDRNPSLAGGVELRLQSNKKSIFEGVIRSDDYFDLTICNPPFHASAQSAEQAAMRKLRNLKGRNAKRTLNFAGSANELWCKGGERAFISQMIAQSADFKKNVGWFTTLVSSEDNLPHLRRDIDRCGVRECRTIEMNQGNKRSRILAWRYL